jgi:hypothetical protein
VRVLGELKKNPAEQSKVGEHVLTLAHRAREVFGMQPGRRLIHAFTLCGSQMRCYLFDRSGVITSPVFDIHSDPHFTARVFLAYYLQPAKWLGMDPTIKVIKNGEVDTYDPTSHDAEQQTPFIEYPKSSSSNFTRLYIDRDPIFITTSIVCRGSTCWRASENEDGPWDHVIKDQWRNKERQHEGNLLKGISGLEGICHYVWHGDIIIDGAVDETISCIRQGLNARKVVQVPRSNRQLEALLDSRSTTHDGYQNSDGNTYPSSDADNRTNDNNKRPGPNLERSHTPKHHKGVMMKSASGGDRAPIRLYSRTHGRLIMLGVGTRLGDFDTATRLLRALRGALIGRPFVSPSSSREV